jgi:uncharacterized membrane protein (UPF0127 family)
MSSYLIKCKDFEICKEAKIAESFFSRLVGLMFQEKMDGFDGLLITQCNSIHTFFMQYSLDLVFLDKNYKVVKVLENKSPWRMSLMYFSATQVLEVVAGTLKGRVSKGDQLELVCIS